MAALMEIIIKAIDKASDVSKKVENNLKGLGDKTSKALDKATTSGSRFTQSLQQTGITGQSAYAQLTRKQQEYLQGLSKGQALTDRLGISGTRMGKVIASGYDTVHNAVNRVKSGVETLKSRIESTTVGQKLITGWDTIKTKVSTVAQAIRTGIGNALDTAKSKVESLNSRMGELGTVITSAFGALGMGSIYEMTIGLAMVRERMTTLMTATMGSAQASKEFVGYLDKMTDSSLVSLNDLGNAMAKIKMSTGMTNAELKLIAPTVNDIGQRALMMGKSTGEAQELMVAAFRGLNGEFEMLKSNFGITRQSLIDAGWSGAADDVAGYNTALQKVLENGGSMETMLESTEGQIQLVKKGFSTAGRQIGETFIPAIKVILGFMVHLKNTNPVVFKLVIVTGALVSAFALLLPVLGVIIGSFKSLLIFLGLVQGAENATTLATIKSTVATKARAAADKIAGAARAIHAAATGAHTTVTEVGTMATIKATLAQWKLNLAFLANPVMIVVLAIIALVAILAILYHKNETVRNAINWLWSGLQQLGGYIMGGLTAAWNAIVGTLTWFWGILTTVWDVLQNNPIAQIVTALLTFTNPVLFVITHFELVKSVVLMLWAKLQEFAGYVSSTFISAWDSITTALSPLITALSGLWDALMRLFGAMGQNKAEETSNTFSMLAGAATAVYNAISWLAGIVGGALKQVFDALYPILVQVATIIGGYFAAVWKTIGGVIMAVIGHFTRVINILTDLVEGNITAGEALGQIWESTKTLLLEIIMSIWEGIGQFVFNMIQAGINAAMGFVNNIILWLMQLPGQLWMWLLQTIMQINMWALNIRQQAINAGIGFITGLINHIRNLPGQIWAWLVLAAQRIVAFANAARERARQAGIQILNGIIDNVKKAPERVYNELLRIGQRILSAGGWLFDQAKALGQRIYNGLLAGLGISSPGYMYYAMAGELDLLDQILDDNQKLLGDKAQSIGDTIQSNFNPDLTMGAVELQTINTSTPEIPVPPTSIVDAQLPENHSAQIIADANLTQTGVTSAYNLMSSTVTSSVNSMVNNDKSSWLKIKNNTNTQLAAIRNSTKNVTGEMVGAWDTMKDGIISNAEKIRSTSSQRIQSLSINIRTFYDKLINPRKWFAGPAPSNISSSGGSKSISRSINFAGPNSSEDLLDSFLWHEAPCTDCYAGGWSFSEPNNTRIQDTLHGYNVTLPDITGLNVGDFKNTTNPLMGSMKLFEAVAENLISKTGYDFYYNGRYSNLEALDRGRFNCWDGAEIMIGLANAMGIPASMIWGKWGNIGHVAAVVGGKIFDTTQRQKRGVWRGAPGVSFGGPGPSSRGFQDNDGTGNVIELKEKIDLTLTVDLEGVPDGIDENKLIRILKVLINDSDLVKKLVKDRNFQDLLKIELAKSKNRTNRASGSI